jgi:hypothetical protein
MRRPIKVWGRSLTSSMAIVAVALLLAACGGGSKGTAGTASIPTTASTASTSSSAQTPTPTRRAQALAPTRHHHSPCVAASVGNQVVSAAHGGFRTVIPSCYKDHLAARAASTTEEVEYMAIGSEAGILTVYRAAAGNSDVAAVASRVVSHLSKRPAFAPKLRQMSSQQALSIDGAPAIAIAYELAERTTTQRRRQIFVVHGGWAYEISDLASPSRYAASLRALDEVIHSWRWR